MPELSPVAEAVWEAFNEDEAGVFVENLDDGCVRVSVGGLSATCSSHHLVPDKIAQPKRALERKSRE